MRFTSVDSGPMNDFIRGGKRDETNRSHVFQDQTYALCITTNNEDSGKYSSCDSIAAKCLHIFAGHPLCGDVVQKNNKFTWRLNP
jgi:hypothetical protein